MPVVALDHVQVTAPEGREPRARAGGVDVAWDAELPGVERCFVHDPWGNRLELPA